MAPAPGAVSSAATTPGGIAIETRLTESGRAALSAGLVLTVVAVAFEALAVPTAMPMIARELGGRDAYGWAFSSFMLATILGITAAGQHADRRGPLASFVAGLALFALGLAVAGAAPGLAALLAGRVLQGLGGGALSAVVYACVGRAYPAEAQPRMLATLSSAWVLPALVGPGLAGVVTDHVGWRAVFFGLIPLLPLAGALALPSLRGLARAEPQIGSGERRMRASAALAAGAALLLLALELRPLPAALACAAAGAGLALPGLTRLLPRGTLRLAAGLPAAVASMGVVSAAFFGAEALVPLLLVELRAQSAALAGAALTSASLAWTAGAWLQARFARTRSRRALVACGAALIALAVAGIASLLHAATPLAVAWLAWAVAGLGMGLAHATISLTVLEEAEPGAEGFASSAMQLAHALGVAAGAGLAGASVAALEPGAGFGLAFAAMGGFALLALAGALRLPGRAARLQTPRGACE